MGKKRKDISRFTVFGEKRNKTEIEFRKEIRNKREKEEKKTTDIKERKNGDMKIESECKNRNIVKR